MIKMKKRRHKRKTKKTSKRLLLGLFFVFLIGSVVLFAFIYKPANIERLCLIGASGQAIISLDASDLTEKPIQVFRSLPLSHRYSFTWTQNRLYVGLTSSVTGYVYQINLKEETLKELKVPGTVMDIKTFHDKLFVITIDYPTRKSYLIEIDLNSFSIANKKTFSKYAPGTPYELAIAKDGKIFVVSYNSSSRVSYLSAFEGVKHLKTITVAGNAALHVETIEGKVYVRSRDELIVYSANTLSFITRVSSLYGYGAVRFQNGYFYVAGITREGQPQLYILDSNLAIQSKIQLSQTTGTATSLTFFEGKIFILGLLHNLGCAVFLVENNNVDVHVIPNTVNCWPSEIICLEAERK